MLLIGNHVFITICKPRPSKKMRAFHGPVHNELVEPFLLNVVQIAVASLSALRGSEGLSFRPWSIGWQFASSFYMSVSSSVTGDSHSELFTVAGTVSKLHEYSLGKCEEMRNHKHPEGPCSNSRWQLHCHIQCTHQIVLPDTLRDPGCPPSSPCWCPTVGCAGLPLYIFLRFLVWFFNQVWESGCVYDMGSLNHTRLKFSAEPGKCQCNLSHIPEQAQSLLASGIL